MPTRRNFLKSSLLFSALAGFTPAFAGDEKKTAALSKELFHVTMADRLKPKLPARKIDIPDVGGFKVLKGDLHIHTLFSDGNVMPADRVTEAVANGLDVIAITDHIEARFKIGTGQLKLQSRTNDHNFAYDLARPEAEKRGLLLVRGTEITKNKFPPGHFNALFIQDANPIAAAVDDWRQMLQVAKDQGAFLLWNHPGWVAPQWGGLANGQPMSFTPEHEEAYKKGLMHGIEVFNGVEHYPIVSDWCNEKDLAIFANSDIHPCEAECYGLRNPFRPMNLILAKERTLDSVKEAFFEKRVIGWAAGNLWGRKESLAPLFDACVKIETAGNKAQLTNRSDIPCTITYAKKDYELPAKGTVEFVLQSGQKTLAVANWFTATATPLVKQI